MSVPSLNTEEYQYLDYPTGLILNSSVALPFFDITSIDGLDSSPVVPIQSDQPGSDGGWVDAPNESVRTITIEGTAYALPTALESYLNSLKANYAPSGVDQPFYFRTDDESTVHFCNGKSLGFHYTKDNRRSSGIVDGQIQIVCQDPRIYSTVQRQTTVAVGSNNSISIQGNRDTPPTLTLNGPLTAPITITYGIYTLTYLDTLTTEHIVIDVLNRHVYNLNTGNNKRGRLTISPTGKWPMLMPGSNVFALAAAGGTGTLSITGRSAWR